MRGIDNKPGDQFGSLTLIKREDAGKKYPHWLCLCICGNTKVVQRANLRYGHTKSCGCLAAKLTSKRNTTHKLTGTKIYRTWRNMHTRCENTNSKDYKNYGGRGIEVCEEWFDFNCFYKDMNSSFQKHVKEHGESDTSLDRINNNGNYDKHNCRWATKSLQAYNRRKKNEIKK